VNDDPSSRSAVRRSGRTPKRSRREGGRLVAVAAISALGALFAVLNLDEVEVNWIVGTFDTPLIVVIAAATLVGALLGVVVTRRRAGGT
jgi:uncharacterized integral membrane protein